MNFISFNNDRHPVSKTLTALHSNSLHLSTLHYFPVKLHPTTFHYTSLSSHLASPHLNFLPLRGLTRPILGPTQPPVKWIPGLSRGVKSGRGVTLTPHPPYSTVVKKEYSYTSTPPTGRTACTEPQCLYKSAFYLLVPWSRKSIAIPILPLRAVRPVQSLSAYTRVYFTFTFFSMAWE